MVHLFTHYVPGRLLLLVILETLILLFAAFAGLSLDYVGAGEAAVFRLEKLFLPEVLIFASGMMVVMLSMGLYGWDAWRDTRSIGVRLAGAFLLGFLALAVLSHWSSSLNPGFGAISAMIAIALPGTWAVRTGFDWWNSLSSFKSRVLVLGTGSRVSRLAEYRRHNSHSEIVGYLALKPAMHYVPASHILTLGPKGTLLSLVKKHAIDQIVVAVRDRRGGGLPIQELLECKAAGINVVELATYFEREYRQVMLESLNPSWMVLGDGFRQGLMDRAVKRIFDLTISVMLLVLTLPIVLVSALLIFLESGWPVFYRQERVGRDGRVFKVLKLRSMKHDAEQDGTPHWASPNDERTTIVGRFIRKWRIDELPQLFNVLRGEMSLVGPRPERPQFVEQLEKQIPYYALRHSAKPGITGWAQVRYPYGASVDDAVEKLQYDLYYVKNRGLFLDLAILLATVEVVLWGRGAR